MESFRGEMSTMKLHEYSCLQKSNDGERMGYKSEWNEYTIRTFPRMEKFNMSSLAMNMFRESC